MEEPTCLLQLVQQLVMLAPQLRPLRELVLAARGVELTPGLEVLALLGALLGSRFRQGRREGCQDAP